MIEWHETERDLIALSPLRNASRAELVLKKLKNRNRRGDSWLIAGASKPEVSIKRLVGTYRQASKQAAALATRLETDVILARCVGLDAHDMPLFEPVKRAEFVKADPMSVEAFDDWALQMTRGILNVSRADLTAMSTEALEYLAMDFSLATPAAIDQGLLGYRTTIAGPSQNMIRLQRLEINRVLEDVLRKTGAAAMKLPEVRAGLGTGFQVRDRVVSDLISKHHSFWVRDRYGNISNAMSNRARRIIADGVERGYDNRTIGQELAQMTGRGVRQESYYQTVAGVHVSRARSYSIGSTFRAAGVQFFKIEAVLDDRTTHQCVFLHGKILPVGPSMAAIERTLADPNPESVLVNQPFIKDEGDRLTISDGAGGTRTVANITQRSSGMGPRGHDAAFANEMRMTEMVDAAIGFPPYHFGCRTTVVGIGI